MVDDGTVDDGGPTDFGPLNDQAGRQQLVRALLELLQPEAIVETGTYLGRTTRWLAEATSAPVYTVEADPDLWHRDPSALAELPQVHAELGDSRQLLRRWALDPDVPHGRCLFYLDAHWAEDLPLAEEVAIVLEAWSDPVLLIDDVEVPDDPGYGYDDYGPGRALCLDYLAEVAGGATVALFPTLPGEQESGWRRGLVVLARPTTAALLEASLDLRARPWPGDGA